jgi:hypothetical protein
MRFVHSMREVRPMVNPQGGTESGTRGVTDDARTPDPRETPLGDGSLAVSSHWVHGTRNAVTVTSEDRPLYELLREVLADVWVPDLMPARLAIADECDDLVDVRRAVEDIERGSADVGGVGWGMGYCKRVRDAIQEHRDRDPVRFVAVGCSGSKHEEPEFMPARERYSSGYWTVKRRYGEAFGEHDDTDQVYWRIISAEYGLLHPDTPIEDYETTPEQLEGVPVDSDARLPNGDAVTTLLDQWAVTVYDGLQEWLHWLAGGVDPRDAELEVLLGRPYRDRLEARDVFDSLRAPGDLTVSFPFQEVEQAQGGNGNQMDWMTDEIDAAQAVATDGGESA